MYHTQIYAHIQLTGHNICYYRAHLYTVIGCYNCCNQPAFITMPIQRSVVLLIVYPGRLLILKPVDDQINLETCMFILSEEWKNSVLILKLALETKS